MASKEAVNIIKDNEHSKEWSKEAIEKILCPHHQNFSSPACGRCIYVAQDYTSCKNPKIEQILTLKLPQGKPPLLSEVDIANLGIYTGDELPTYLVIAQAQWEIWNKWYEGGKDVRDKG